MLSLSLDGFAASWAKVNDSTPCIGSKTGSRLALTVALFCLFENSHNVHLYMKLLTIFHSNGFWITASPTMSSFEKETAMSSAHRAIMSLDKKMV